MAQKTTIKPLFENQVHIGSRYPYDKFPINVNMARLAQAAETYIEKQGNNGISHMGSQIKGYIDHVGAFIYSLDAKGNPANDKTRAFFQAIDTDLGEASPAAAALKTFPWRYSRTKLLELANVKPPENYMYT